MSTRYAVECDDEQAQAVARLASRYGLSEEEVLKQLLELGLESIEEAP